MSRDIIVFPRPLCKRLESTLFRDCPDVCILRDDITPNEIQYLKTQAKNRFLFDRYAVNGQKYWTWEEHFGTNMPTPKFNAEEYPEYCTYKPNGQMSCFNTQAPNGKGPGGKCSN